MLRFLVLAALAACSVSLAAAGVALATRGASDVLHGHRSTGWPTVVGTVERSELRTYRSGASVGRTAMIAYRYEVDGVGFVNDRFRYGAGGTGSGPGPAGGWVHEHPVGSSVTVFHDPADPAESTLETGVVGRAFGMLTLAAALVSMALWIGWTGGRRVLRRAPPARLRRG